MGNQVTKKVYLTFLQKKKRSFIKRLLVKFINTSHSYVIQHLPEWMKREAFDFEKLRSIWDLDTLGNNQVDYVRLLFLIETVRDIEKNIPGSFAELGVYKGLSAKVIHEIAPDRKLFLFDTFSGFHKEDFKAELEKKYSSNNFEDSSLESVRKLLGFSENIIFCPGYFPETTAHISSEEVFALVHLDADLYNPTKAAMEYFYPRMSPKGIMILHDYSSGAWPGVKQAVDEFLQDKPETLVYIPDKSGTAVLRKISICSQKK